MSSKRSRAQVLHFFGDTFYRTPDEHRQAYEFEQDTSHEPVVYYMRMDRLVKIGWTVNIRSRVETIGPQGVLAVEDGDRAVERARHKQFVDLHSHREWFWLRDALAEHIVHLRADFEQRREGMTTEEWLEARGVRSTAIAAPGSPA